MIRQASGRFASSEEHNSLIDCKFLADSFTRSEARAQRSVLPQPSVCSGDTNKKQAQFYSEFLLKRVFNAFPYNWFVVFEIKYLLI